MAGKSTAAERWRAGVEVARDYAVPATALAPLLGLTAAACAARLRRDGVDPEGGGLRMKIYRALSEQLRTIRATLADGALDKAQVDALTAYVRAMERVLDLLGREEMREASPEVGGGMPALSPAELSEVLLRIEARIDELARQRATELVEGQPDGLGGGRRRA